MKVTAGLMELRNFATRGAGLRLEGIGEVEVPADAVVMAGEGFDFLASVDEDFEALDLRDVGGEGGDDGVDGELFAGDAAGSGDGQGFGEVSDAGAVGEEIEGQEDGVGWESAMFDVDGAGEESVEDLFGAQDGIG